MQKRLGHCYYRNYLRFEESPGLSRGNGGGQMLCQKYPYKIKAEGETTAGHWQLTG